MVQYTIIVYGQNAPSCDPLIVFFPVGGLWLKQYSVWDVLPLMVNLSAYQIFISQ